MKTLRVGKFPGTIKEVAVPEEATVQEVLEIAELDGEGYEVQLDGNVVSLDSGVGQGNLLILSKKVKGA